MEEEEGDISEALFLSKQAFFYMQTYIGYFFSTRIDLCMEKFM